MKRLLITTFMIVLIAAFSASASTYCAGAPAKIGPRSTSVMLEYQTDVPIPKSPTLNNRHASVSASKALQLYSTSKRDFHSYGNYGTDGSGVRLADHSYQHIRSSQPVYNFTSTSLAFTKGKLHTNGHFSHGAETVASPAVRKNSPFPQNPLDPFMDPVGELPLLLLLLFATAYVAFRSYKKKYRLYFRKIFRTFATQKL